MSINALIEVQVFLHVAGEFNFMMQVSVRNPEKYEEFLLNRLCILEL